MVVVGIDEVGRGSWAGPVVAGAVVLSRKIDGLKDSKALSPRRREELSIEIKYKALAYGIGWADVELINSKGLTFAISYAMRQALSKIALKYDQIVIDGNYNFLNDNNRAVTITKADQTHPAVSAASIIAKVERDNFMKKVSTTFADYGFELNKGYGTKYHLEKLLLNGPCIIHRAKYKPIIRLAQQAGI